MKRSTSRQASFLRSFLSGVALPAEVETRHRFRSAAGTDLDRMRGDVARVGQAFGYVLNHEREKTGTASSAKA